MTLYFRNGDMKLKGFVDIDLVGDVDNKRDTIGYVYTLRGIVVSWVSQLQKVVALSTTKVEYIAIIEASKEMNWVQGFSKELERNRRTISFILTVIMRFT